MKDGKEPDRGTEAFRIGRNRKQRFRRGAEKDAINLARVLKRQAADLLRQREHNVEVRNRQQVGFSRCQPPGTRHSLTFLTVPVATRVI